MTYLEAHRLTKFVAVCVLAACMIAAGSQAVTAADVPDGIWLMGTKVAIQIFDCSNRLCGRVIWLKAPLDPQGLLKRDTLNPDPALRDRQVCGPTIIWNLRPADAAHRRDGWFYNADDGKTYRLTAEFQPNDVIVARMYVGIPLFGETRTLVRVPMGASAGWC
jgi:uncharacterized protein (DUF2147 family)